jgi:hypothetical protein
MENLHLKNLNNNQTKKHIELILNSININNEVIQEFKDLYITDLYDDNYDTEHLIEIANEMIYIINITKNFIPNQKLTDDEIKKLEQEHLLLITKYEYVHYTDYLIQYTTNPEGEFDTDYKEISIIIDKNNIIEEINYSNI